MKQHVAIFRMQLFKVSEPFIEKQAMAFCRYKPVFVGQSLFGKKPEGFEMLTTHEGKSRWLRAASQIFPSDGGLASRLTAYNPKIMHAHFAVDAVYAVPVAHLLKIPLVTTLHGFDVTRSNPSFLASCRPALVNSVLWRSHLQKSGASFICVSNFIRQTAIKKGYPIDKLIVHYIGTDTEKNRPACREANKRQTIIHVARLIAVKGTLYLIRAFAKLCYEFPYIELKIIGDGELRPLLEREARNLGIQNKVEFLGARPHQDTLQRISQADVLVAPSITTPDGYAEALGLVTQEAGAFAVPVVVSNSGGIAEAVKDGETGFVVPEKDVDVLAERISRLLRDPDMARQMGVNARVYIEENFNIRKQSVKLEAIYDDVLTGSVTR